ncbi:metal ABC transporter permease [Nocardia cyriacigeorgica]|uniref:metal ABC transporter permease n=1 Tax=Nocardia cyriacigeorgica TaxID=135487 RepID=UPI00313C1044
MWGGLLVSCLCAIAGTWVVVRGMAFLSDAMAHGVVEVVAPVEDQVDERLRQRLARVELTGRVEAVAGELIVQPVVVALDRARAEPVGDVVLDQRVVEHHPGGPVAGVVEGMAELVRHGGIHRATEHRRMETAGGDPVGHPLPQQARVGREPGVECHRVGDQTTGAAVLGRAGHADQARRHVLDADAPQLDLGVSGRQIDHGPGVFAGELGIDSGPVEADHLEIGVVQERTQLGCEAVTDFRRGERRPFIDDGRAVFPGAWFRLGVLGPITRFRYRVTEAVGVRITIASGTERQPVDECAESTARRAAVVQVGRTVFEHLDDPGDQAFPVGVGQAFEQPVERLAGAAVQRWRHSPTAAAVGREVDAGRHRPDIEDLQRVMRWRARPPFGRHRNLAPGQAVHHIARMGRVHFTVAERAFADAFSQQGGSAPARAVLRPRLEVLLAQLREPFSEAERGSVVLPQAQVVCQDLVPGLVAVRASVGPLGGVSVDGLPHRLAIGAADRPLVFQCVREIPQHIGVFGIPGGQLTQRVHVTARFGDDDQAWRGVLRRGRVAGDAVGQALRVRFLVVFQVQYAPHEIGITGVVGGRIGGAGGSVERGRVGGGLGRETPAGAVEIAHGPDDVEQDLGLVRPGAIEIALQRVAAGPLRRLLRWRTVRVAP